MLTLFLLFNKCTIVLGESLRLTQRNTNIYVVSYREMTKPKFKDLIAKSDGISCLLRLKNRWTDSQLV